MEVGDRRFESVEVVKYGTCHKLLKESCGFAA